MRRCLLIPPHSPPLVPFLGSLNLILVFEGWNMLLILSALWYEYKHPVSLATRPHSTNRAKYSGQNDISESRFCLSLSSLINLFPYYDVDIAWHSGSQSKQLYWLSLIPCKQRQINAICDKNTVKHPIATFPTSS